MQVASLLLLAGLVQGQTKVLEEWEVLKVRDGAPLETMRHPARRLAESPFEVRILLGRTVEFDARVLSIQCLPFQ